MTSLVSTFLAATPGRDVSLPGTLPAPDPTSGALPCLAALPLSAASPGGFERGLPPRPAGFEPARPPRVAARPPWLLVLRPDRPPNLAVQARA
jgi:hypothetical protein